MKTLYLFPYFISGDVISFAYIDDNSEIVHRKNANLNDVIELTNSAERVVTYEFMKLFANAEQAFNQNIIDVYYINQLYKNQVINFCDNNKHATVVKNFRKAQFLIVHKMIAFKKTDPAVVNDTKLEIAPIQLIFQKHIVENIVSSFLNYLEYFDKQFLLNIDTSYYDNLFKNYLYVYNNLSEAMVNKAYITELLKTNGANNVPRQIVTATKNLKNNMIPVPCYNLFSSKTGRPYIKRGVNYQQLPVNNINVIQSRWPDGKIVEFDINACEIRSALFAVGRAELANKDTDVYMYFLKSVRDAGVRLDRKKAKQLIIMMLFGATNKTIAQLAKMSENDAKVATNTLMGEFKISIIHDKVNNARNMYGYFTNHFGRPIYTDEDRESTLIQNFIQSTAIDICHSGYAALIRHIKDNVLDSRVLYTKHDAIYLDIHPKEFDKIDLFKQIIGQTNIDGIKFKINSKDK